MLAQTDTMMPRTGSSTNVAIEVRLERITPADAAKLLESSRVNRNLRPNVVAAYRRDMEAGRWAMTGEPIQLSRTGMLLNGQHRLTALADATVEGIDMLVVTGLADEAQTLMDQGAPRAIKDALQIAYGSVKNIAIVSSLTRWVTAHPDPGVPNMAGSFGSKVSAAEAVQTYTAYKEEIDEAARAAVALTAYVPGSITGLAYAWLFINRADPAACNEFFGAMVELSFDLKNDTRKAVLRALQRTAADPIIKQGQRQTAIMLISILTRGFNAWHRGEQLTTIVATSTNGIIQPVKPL